jgi:hypothetical protein
LYQDPFRGQDKTGRDPEEGTDAMGIEKIRFKEEVNIHLICQICDQVLEEPVLVKCNHTFCRKCVSNGTLCPKDGLPVSSDDPKDAPDLIIQMLGDLEVVCDFAGNGCNTRLKLRDLDIHVQSCSHNSGTTVRCHRRCKRIVKRSEALTHSCAQLLLETVQQLEEQLMARDEIIQEKDREITQLKDMVRGNYPTVVLNPIPFDENALIKVFEQEKSPSSLKKSRRS